MTVERIQEYQDTLTVHTDANWAGDLDTRHSTSGLISILNGNVISWVSQKQNIVATSTTEAEYEALSSMSKEVLFLRHFLNTIQCGQNSTLIYADNIGANFLAENAKISSRTKHIDIKYHHVRELIATKKVHIAHVATIHNLADILTKPLAKIRFNALTNNFLVARKL